MSLDMGLNFICKRAWAIGLLALGSLSVDLRAQDALSNQKQNSTSPPVYYQLNDEPSVNHDLQQPLSVELLPAPNQQDRSQRDPTIPDVDLRALLNTPTTEQNIQRQIPEVKMRARIAMSGGSTIGILEVAGQRYLIEQGKSINVTTKDGFPLTIQVARLSANEVVLDLKELDQAIQLR